MSNKELTNGKSAVESNVAEAISKFLPNYAPVDEKFDRSFRDIVAGLGGEARIDFEHIQTGLALAFENSSHLRDVDFGLPETEFDGAISALAGQLANAGSQGKYLSDIDSIWPVGNLNFRPNQEIQKPAVAIVCADGAVEFNIEPLPSPNS